MTESKEFLISCKNGFQKLQLVIVLHASLECVLFQG